VLHSQLAPTSDRHGCGRHSVDALADCIAVGLVRPQLVGVAGRVTNLDGVEAPLGDRVCVVGAQVRDLVSAISSVIP
jgi:hypothetical protein